jgi:hypothetical protein
VLEVVAPDEDQPGLDSDRLDRRQAIGRRAGADDRVPELLGPSGEQYSSYPSSPL